MGSKFFNVKSSFPKTRFTANRMVNLVLEGIKEEVEGFGVAEYKKTVATWKNPPKITGEKTANGARIRIGNINVRGKSKPIWFYLDEGTSKRFVIMSSDFVPKTRVGTVRSFRGSGQVSRGTRVAKPGIKARGWSDILNVRMQKRIQKGIRNAIKSGLISPI